MEPIYVIADIPLRCSMDPRDPAVESDPLAAVKLSVRAERLADLERLYDEGQFGLFDHWVVKWFGPDPELYLHLSLPAHASAAAVLYDEGLL